MTRHQALFAAESGLLAGMRTMSAPTWVACSRTGGHARLKRALAIAATLEMIVDKLPFTPARTSLPQLLARAGAGALSAIYASHSEKSRWKLRALLGALGAACAVASTFASYRLRRLAGETRIPDAALGAAEDAIVLGAGSFFFKKAA